MMRLKNTTTHRRLTWGERQEIRAWYEARMASIMSATNGWGVIKYDFPYIDQLSPLERMVFDECVSAGLPMYPEFPVGRFFVDLGNPVSKIAIECDGREFHHDKQRDAKRDAELQALGWAVYRIEASRIFCWPDSDPLTCRCETDESCGECWQYRRSLEWFVEQLRQQHVESLPESVGVNLKTVSIGQLCKRAIDDAKTRRTR